MVDHGAVAGGVDGQDLSRVVCELRICAASANTSLSIETAKAFSTIDRCSTAHGIDAQN